MTHCLILIVQRQNSGKSQSEWLRNKETIYHKTGGINRWTSNRVICRWFVVPKFGFWRMHKVDGQFEGSFVSLSRSLEWKGHRRPLHNMRPFICFGPFWVLNVLSMFAMFTNIHELSPSMESIGFWINGLRSGMRLEWTRCTVSIRNGIGTRI